MKLSYRAAPVTDYPSQNSSSGGPVTGWNIFWALLTLSLSCITHPIGSSCGFPLVYRRSVRASILVSFFDTAHLVYEVLCWYSSSACPGLPKAMRRATEERLRNNIVGGAYESDLKTLLHIGFLDLRVRSIVAALCILQYVKLCGYKWIPFWFSVSTILPVSWVVMELVFIIGCLAHWKSFEAPELPDVGDEPHSDDEPPKRDRLATPQKVSRVLVFLEIAVLVFCFLLNRQFPGRTQLGHIANFYVWIG